MKIKSIVSRRKKHELRSMVLELAAKANWKETELLASGKVITDLKNEIEQIKAKFDVQEKLLADTKDQLINQKNITGETAKAASDVAQDYYEQSKEIDRLNEQLRLTNIELEKRYVYISALNNSVSKEQSKVVELTREIEELKKPWFKKVLRRG